MNAKVFISYRRDDSMGQAGRIHDRLAHELGRDLLFMDVDDIPLGVNFVKVLREEVAKCNVLLAIIGPKWVDARDEHGNRRLDNPDDFVRIEIASALQRDIPVIPILLEGTRVPNANQLPKDLEGLALHNGLDVRHASFHNDMDKLVRGLKGRASTTIVQPTLGSSPSEAAPGTIAVDVGTPSRKETRYFVPGNGRSEWFKDHEAGPEMVVLPAGTFMMGSPETEPERESWQKGSESPQHLVTIAQPFAAGRHLVTRAQFAAFVKAADYKADDAHDWTSINWENEHRAPWLDPGFAQGDNHPVVCVSWLDAKAYAAWCAKVSGRLYRLLSEAEWEYAARAGTTTPFWWGASITTSEANYNGNYVYKGGGSKGVYRRGTVPVSSFAANPWGLYNVHGNVWEWCEDAWHDNYNGAPPDGSAWLQAGDASRRVLRGGSWSYNPGGLRSAGRAGDSSEVRSDGRGFRIAAPLVA
jgi:formylglycine-generating enzyme required for sulfatase activity